MDLRLKEVGTRTSAPEEASARLTGKHIGVSASGAAAQDALHYRAEIDGLRAISVIAVILFHAKIPGFRGGYVGVDVFFVISGFLITRILMVETNRSFGAQLAEFYVRRSRRILPALMVMVILALAAALLLFLPSDLVRFGKHVAFTSVFLSNIASWTDGGYFDLHTPFSPLLHLWSIAVEEQFYLAYPLLFLACSRYLVRQRLLFVCLIALLSVGLCIWASYHKPAANFFLAPTRAWELMLGTLVALGVAGSLEHHPARALLAIISLITIVLCVALYDDQLQYPGLFAIPPCFAAATLIASLRGPSCGVGRLLCAKPLVFTGLISYSLYLWHAPILAFLGYYNIRPLDWRKIALVLALIYVISAASWLYVEKPIRTRAVLRSNRSFVTLAVAMTFALALTGVVIWRSDGLPQRLSHAERVLTQNIDRLHADVEKCAMLSVDQIASGSLCSYGPDGAGVARAVVWGDSHALVLLPAYERIAKARGVRLYIGAAPACRPLMDASGRTENKRQRTKCAEFNTAMLGAIRRIDPSLVILNAFWTYPDVDLVATGDLDVRSSDSVFKRSLEKTLQLIDSDKRSICIVRGVPVLKYTMPYAYALARRREMDTDFLAVRHNDAAKQYADLDMHILSLQERGSLRAVDPKDLLCPMDKCRLVADDGRSLYRDKNHLSMAGAQLVGSVLDACFDVIR